MLQKRCFPEWFPVCLHRQHRKQTEHASRWTFSETFLISQTVLLERANEETLLRKPFAGSSKKLYVLSKKKTSSNVVHYQV